MEFSEEDAAWVWGKLRGACLPRFPFQNDFTEHLESIQKCTMPSGQTIIHQGQPGETCYLIKSGSVSVWADVPSGRKKLAVLQAGEFFGEVSILTGEVRNATVIAEKDAELFVIPAPTLLDMIRKSPSIGENLVGTISHRHGAGAFGFSPFTPASPSKTLYARFKALFKPAP